MGQSPRLQRVVPVLVVWALVLVGCGGGPGTSVDLGPSSEPPSESAPSMIPPCEKLKGEPYSPPAAEQPPADPAITNAQPRPDIAPLESEDSDPERPRAAVEAPPDMMSQVQQWAQREAPQHFAGLWFDNDEDATVIAFTQNVDAYAEQVREQFGAGWWVVAAEHSMAELQQAQSRLREEMGAGWNAGGDPEPGTIYASGINVTINRVTLSIIEPDEQRIAELSQRYGADAICLEIEKLPGEEDALPAAWEPAPGADLSPGSTAIDVHVVESACASGQPATGRIADPDIPYEEERVVVTIGVVPRAGGQTCPSNLPTDYTVELDEPLGDRVLLDGSHEPPAEPDLDRPPPR